MKRAFLVCVLMVFLFGCKSADDDVGRFISMRKQILESNGCEFTATVTADYGDSTYTFVMDCSVDHTGDMHLAVTAPETISGIKARFSKGTGKLVFEDKTLVFALVADGQITPVCAPWLIWKALTGGYISASGKAGEKMYTQIDDSYSGVDFSMEIWEGENQLPERAEIIWDGRRIMSININDFVIL